jgi:uncharacterized protein with PhoU and TrkA domain
MKVLKTLTFGVMSRGSQNPVLARRAKLVHRLEQQKRLAQDANFVVTVSRWLKNEAGGKELVKLQKRVRPWWCEDVLGAVGLTVRYGAKAIEFEKGKNAIIVPSKDQLAATLDTVITAVRAGELDEYLSQQAKDRSAPKQKRLAQDPNFVVTVSRWVRNEGGSRERVQLQKRVRPWWREDVLGTVGLTVRYGAKAIEFEKGKNAIVVPSKDQLVATIDTVIEGVKAGELDEHLDQYAKARGVPRSTRAA